MNTSRAIMVATALMGIGIPKGSTGNKYQPHQGKQEIARRLRGAPESKPRRMWVLTTMYGKISNSRRTPLKNLYFSCYYRSVLLP